MGETVPNRRKGIVGVLASAIALVAVTLGGWWWSHPNLLDPGGSGGMILDPRPVKESVLTVGIAHPREGAKEERLVLHGAQAHFIHNSAHGSARFVVCTTRRDDWKFGGSTTDPLSKFCTRVRPLKDDTVVAYREDSDYVVLIITPKRAGTATLASIDFSHSRDWHHLWQRGTQHLSQFVKVRTT